MKFNPFSRSSSFRSKDNAPEAKAPEMALTMGGFVWMVLWRLAVSALIIVGLYRFKSSYAMIPFMLAIPVIGILAAGPIMIAIGAWYDWQRGQPYAKWQGNYYEFANTQIRVFEMPNDTANNIANDTTNNIGQLNVRINVSNNVPINAPINTHEPATKLWFCDRDILKVIGRKPTSQLKALYKNAEYRYFIDEKIGAFSEIGVKKLLMMSTHYESKRLMLWIEREVIKVHRRRLELQSP